MLEHKKQNIFTSVKRWFLLTFVRKVAIASDIIETVNLPLKVSLSHILPIKPGTSKSELVKLLDEVVLRKDEAPIDGIEFVLSSNAWPTIERFFIEGGCLSATLFELGCDCSNINYVYTRVRNHIQRYSSQSMVVTPQKISPYAIISWQVNGLHCFLQVLNDKIVNINPLFWPRDIFGEDPNGTFIFKSGKRHTVLPTIAIIIAKDSGALARVFAYLQKDLAIRCNCVSLLNLPSILDA